MLFSDQNIEEVVSHWETFTIKFQYVREQNKNLSYTSNFLREVKDWRYSWDCNALAFSGCFLVKFHARVKEPHERWEKKNWKVDSIERIIRISPIILYRLWKSVQRYALFLRCLFQSTGAFGIVILRTYKGHYTECGNYSPGIFD